METRFLIFDQASDAKPARFIFRVIISSAIFLLFTTPPLRAQDNPTLTKLYNNIKAQEANFPIPKSIETITVGTLDLSYGKAGDIPRKFPSYDFAIEKYTDGTTYKVYKQIIPSKDFPDFTSMTLDVANQGGTINVANISQLNLRVAINNWDQYPAGGAVVFKLGSQIKTIQKGATEVVFQNITDTSPSFSITVNGYEMIKGTTEPFIIKGLLPFYIRWQTMGAGVITIPVLPVSITYAPLTDQQKLNTTIVAGNSATTTSISFTTPDGTAKAVPSSFQSVGDIQKRMSVMSSTLSKVPDSTTTTIGKTLAEISSGLKSLAATQNISIIISPQGMLTLGNPSSATQTVPINQGGPSVGDLISYYYNAKVLWYSENGVMSLALLGADGFAQPTVSQLKAALQSATYAQWHLNASSIKSLLSLDPLAQSGSTLNPSRFIDISQGVIQVDGETTKRTFNYTISTFNANSTAKTAVNIENDNAGFPVFLGMGAITDQTLLSQISQGASMQASSGQALSQTFTFNAIADESYSCRVYYDVVYGTFVFRDVTPQNPVELSGTYYDKNRDAIPDAIITLRSGDTLFSTNTDSKGHFKFSLTSSNVGILDLTANNAEVKVEFKGKTVKRVKLVSL